MIGCSGCFEVVFWCGLCGFGFLGVQYGVKVGLVGLGRFGFLGWLGGKFRGFLGCKSGFGGFSGYECFRGVAQNGFHGR